MRAHPRCAQHLQPSIGLQSIARHYHNAPLPHLLLARPRSSSLYRHGERLSRFVYASQSPSQARLFHHTSQVGQAASPLPAAPVEDDDEESAVCPEDASIFKVAEQDSSQLQEAKRAPSRKPFKIDLPKVNIESAIDTMRIAREHGLTTEQVMLKPSPRPETGNRLVRSMATDMRNSVRMKQVLLRARAARDTPLTAGLKQKLPLLATGNPESLLQLVNDKDVAVILAKTGSGKTTQVPQILLDDKIMSNEGSMTNIVCTQPRRMAATSIAEWVRMERHDGLRGSVGYHIRHEKSLPRDNGITYCTTGILLNQLIADPETTLLNYSHIIVDEVHERDIQIDLVLSLLRDAVGARKATGQAYPKVILMSATIDPSTFTEYFTRAGIDGNALTVGCLDLEGRHVHVETHHLPEILMDLAQDGAIPEPMYSYVQGRHEQSSRKFIRHEMQFAAKQAKLGHPEVPELTESTREMHCGLATSVIAHIALTKPEGDILAFFPGSTDMENVEELLRGAAFGNIGLDFSEEDKFRIFKLHSLRRDTNDEVFRPVPEGCRRIILATNIAETSITLPEVVYVVDTGKERNSSFDPATLARSLPYSWISKTSAIQRRGRAGRVRDGHYYALFTKERYDSLKPMNRPEIRDTDLAEVALQLKAHRPHTDVEALLLNTMDPPSLKAVTNATGQLQALGALTDDGEITSLGRLVWRLGVHPALGKAILLGALFGCLEPMLIIACHDAGSPLISSLEVSKEHTRTIRQQYLPESETDFAWILGAFREYHAASLARDGNLLQELRETKHIRERAYLDMMVTSKEIHDTLSSIEFVPPASPGASIFESLPPALNVNRNNMCLVKSLLINTVSAELAAWRGRRGHPNWSIDSTELSAKISKQGVHEARQRGKLRIQQQYRSPGRLAAYTWKKEAPNDSNTAGDLVFLEQSSMVTPLMAILFCQGLAVDRDDTLRLNEWLRLRLSMPAEVSPAIADRSAIILMELRKTIDRFISLGWLELEKLNRSPASGPSVASRSTGQGPSQPRLGPELRKAMVHAVLKMLEADEAHWETFRLKRREENAAAELERLEKKKAEAKAEADGDADTEDVLDPASTFPAPTQGTTQLANDLGEVD